MSPSVVLGRGEPGNIGLEVIDLDNPSHGKMYNVLESVKTAKRTPDGQNIRNMVSTKEKVEDDIEVSERGKVEGMVSDIEKAKKELREEKKPLLFKIDEQSGGESNKEASSTKEVKMVLQK